MHRSLISVARGIAAIDPGRPRQTTMRRAVSTAYYAVFHGLCQLSADILAGRSAPYSDWGAVYRTPDHNIFRAVRDQDLKVRRLGADIHKILDIAIDLQRRRIEADYNPEPLGLGRAEVEALIKSAEAALDALDALGAAERRALAVVLVARPRRKQP